MLVPKPVRTRILKNTLRKNICEFYSSLAPEKITDEQKEILDYLENNPVTIFPYPFSAGYAPEKTAVFSDPAAGMKFVLQDGKKLYFRRGWSKKRIQRAFADLSREQDPLSPHKYLSGDFTLTDNDVAADIGAAEGNFSLAVIERVKKIYLIEYDPMWIKALEATFAPWKEKVVIINKYAAGNDDEKHITIDTLINKYSDINFLKIDVDGNEQSVLDGATFFLSGTRSMKLAICTYHKEGDEKDFTSILEKSRFRVNHSRGFMIHYYDKKIKAPYLRRGLLRAVR